jgi:tight adherence protein C
MPFTVWLAAFAIVISLPVAWWALGGLRVPGKAARANLTTGIAPLTDLREITLQETAHDRVVAPTMSSLARRARRMTPVGMVEALERRIHLAGIADRWPVDRVLGTKVLLAAAGATCGLLRFVTSPSLGSAALGAALSLAAYFAPDLVLDLKARERQDAVTRELADTLDQITVCVEAGLGFEAAVARAAESRGALAAELGRTLQDIQIGIPRARALEGLLARTDSQDLRTFVHAFSQAERYGIPMAQVLRVQSSELREKRRQRAEERAMKMPVKLVFPVVLCILPTLFVIVAGPAVVRVSQTSFGG